VLQCYDWDRVRRSRQASEDPPFFPVLRLSCFENFERRVLAVMYSLFGLLLGVAGWETAPQEYRGTVWPVSLVTCGTVCCQVLPDDYTIGAPVLVVQRLPRSPLCLRGCVAVFCCVFVCVAVFAFIGP